MTALYHRRRREEDAEESTKSQEVSCSQTLIVAELDVS